MSTSASIAFSMARISASGRANGGPVSTPSNTMLSELRLMIGMLGRFNDDVGAAELVGLKD